MIFIDEPMYNEPGFDCVRSTPEGVKKSTEYNNQIRRFTLQHAVIAQVSQPAPTVHPAACGHRP
eukprot:589614-Prorocentrum_minimum.AAC.2